MEIIQTDESWSFVSPGLVRVTIEIKRKEPLREEDQLEIIEFLKKYENYNKYE